MNEMKWEKLTEIFGHIEADVLKSYLEAEGVPVELFQEAIGRHIYPTTINGLARVQIFVPKEKLEEARQLFKAYQDASPNDIEGEQ